MCRNERRSMLIVVLAALLVGCSGDGPTPPDPLADVAGSYVAEGSFGLARLTTTGNDGASRTVDWLAQGASIALTLDDDGTTSGRLFIPGADEDGGDLDQDLTGTWTLSGDRVSLDHEADTFLRDMELVLDGDRLVGEETWSVTVHIELERR